MSRAHKYTYRSREKVLKSNLVNESCTENVLKYIFCSYAFNQLITTHLQYQQRKV